MKIDFAFDFLIFNRGIRCSPSFLPIGVLCNGNTFVTKCSRWWCVLFAHLTCRELPALFLLEETMGKEAVSSDAFSERWSVHITVLAGLMIKYRSNSPLGSYICE